MVSYQSKMHYEKVLGPNKLLSIDSSDDEDNFSDQNIEYSRNVGETNTTVEALKQ